MLPKLAQVLVNAGIISESQAARYQELCKPGENIADVLVREKAAPEEDIAGALAAHYKLPFIYLANVVIESDAAQTITQKFASEQQCCPVRIQGNELTLAIWNPSQIGLKESIEFSKGLKVRLVLTTKTQLLDAIHRIYNVSEVLEGYIKNVQGPADVELLPSELVAPASEGAVDVSQAESRPIVKLVNLIISEAIRLRASDIHIEPQLNLVQVRNRIDGVLIETMTIPKSFHAAVVTRIKIMAELDIAQHRIPQDGRIPVKFGDRQYDIRVSVLPTHLGEKIAMRVLDTSGTVLTLDQMGLPPDYLSLLRTLIRKPQGTILTTGPTGSGKTTTLYGCILEIRRPEINIVTVENPIEYQIPGLNQVQVNEKAGLTFASTLRSILRQDPNVILVGEIRDKETAQVAFQAAATGHLVFSTLHTNSAVGTVTRLLDLGIEPFLVSSSCILIMSQRLLRRICPDCRVPYKPKEDLLEKLGLAKEKIVYFRGAGCNSCKKVGYLGRIGVYEFLPIEGRVRELIAEKAPEHAIEAAQQNMGLRTLLEGSIDLVRQGITNPEEVLRVIKVEELQDRPCPQCRQRIRQEFLSCPYCGLSLKNTCSGCGQELRLDWSICPYCRTQAGTDPSAAAKKTVRLVAAAPPGPPPGHVTTRIASPVPPGGTAMAPPPAPPRPPSDPPPVAPPSKPHPPEPPPAAAVHPFDMPAQGPEIPPAGMPLRVLVVDDEEDIRRLVVAFVKRLRYPTEIHTARDGDEALELIPTLRPHLVILDILMPRVDGFTVCKRMREDVRSTFIPILMMTASRETETKSKAFAVGTDDYVPKPIKPTEFKEKLERLIQRTYGI